VYLGVIINESQILALFMCIFTFHLNRRTELKFRNQSGLFTKFIGRNSIKSAVPFYGDRFDAIGINGMFLTLSQ